MKRTRRSTLAVLAGVSALAMVVAACGSTPTSSSKSGHGLTASAPGITPTTITIGSHQPLTGVAAPGYDEIAPASNAYFKYVNAHGGIYGRKIIYKYLNDQYDPTITSSVVHQLILQDNVYAIFDGLGTPTHLAVAPFINQMKVPDVFVASGCECWNSPSTWPYTFGWQIDYIREGKILGHFIEQHFPGKKVGIFYQNDEFGKDGLKGLSYEIPKSQIVATESYTPTDTNIGPQVAALKAAGAQVVASYSVPAFTALLRLSELGLNYNPAMVISSVGTDPTTLGGLLEAFAKQGHAKIPAANSLIQGIYTNEYLPALSDTGNSWIALFRKIHDTYIPKLPFDGNVLYGEAVAYTFVQAMFKAGRNPTRQDLINAINSGLPQGPSVAPYLYSPTDHNGMSGSYMAEIKNGLIVPIGPVEVTNTSPTGPVTIYTGGQQAAPASGIPSP
jgi:hypothetical protein